MHGKTTEAYASISGSLQESKKVMVRLEMGWVMENLSGKGKGTMPHSFKNGRVSHIANNIQEV